MTTFDGWEARLAAGDEELEHSGILGMKHGRNRYQNPDGTWTPLGLERRRQREGFGERRAARKAARQEARTAKKKAAAKEKAAAARKKAKVAKAKATEKANKKAERAKRLEAFREKRRKKNVKNLTDQEIKDRIARIELEQKYKEMTRSPLIKTTAKAVNSYFTHKQAKADRIAKEKEQKIRELEAKSKILQAKAAKKQATSNIVDTVLRGSKFKGAKAKLKEVKNEEREHTIRGAFSQIGHNILIAKGNKRVKRIEDDESPRGVRTLVDSIVNRHGSDSPTRALDRTMSRLDRARSRQDQRIARDERRANREASRNERRANRETERITRSLNARRQAMDRDAARRERRANREFDRTMSSLNAKRQAMDRDAARRERKRAKQSRKQDKAYRRSATSDYFG